MFIEQFRERSQNPEDLSTRIDEQYVLCHEEWRKDARWLNSYQEPFRLPYVEPISCFNTDHVHLCLFGSNRSQAMLEEQGSLQFSVLP